VRQKLVEKLRAPGRSKRTTRSVPESQAKFAGRAYRLLECAEPVAFRQREQ
jgi:hypothetical protein